MWVFIAAVLLAAGALLFTLVVRAKDIPEAPPVSPTLHLEERKARIYENLRDLQFEYRVGKLSDGDYQKTKQSLQSELAATLSQLDNFKPAAKAASIPSQPKSDGKTCPHCGATFPRPLRFCGECGKAMA